MCPFHNPCIHFLQMNLSKLHTVIGMDQDIGEMLRWVWSTVLITIRKFQLLQMKKGDTIQHFLQKCLDNLRKEFTELRYICLLHVYM